MLLQSANDTETRNNFEKRELEEEQKILKKFNVMTAEQVMQMLGE